jgi:hypothetical protein
MTEQISAEPLSTDAVSLFWSLEPLLIKQGTMKIDNSIPQFSHGERLGALTQIYLAIGLPLQVAFRAAEADLCELGVQKIC